ncbi:hypothetical protein DACRYDRAFT_24282 [Dacryopinax primogenitus]|uniref:DUF6535 domain-containing protein n=1 Tax=Dacryopinax primogenitus (strain DJM 731) TaxID=1858805 RepID=M5FSB2_DACPD|nr:uncharacterized protein DACRYDRAFT_24282 [Dacryopinax primogenitus]EJT98693.1 hypothetical protein DACRYDRAFT_24282 [Dacryopinax primogenitus]
MALNFGAGARRLPVPPAYSQQQNPHTIDAFEVYGLGNAGVGYGGIGYAGGHIQQLAGQSNLRSHRPSGVPNEGGTLHRRTRRVYPATENIVRNESPVDEKTFLDADDVSSTIREIPLAERQRDWRIWPIYVKEATERDMKLAKDWNEDMDVLLIFAGLFSAVVTSFLSQNAISNLQTPYDQYTAAIALQQLSGVSVQLTGDCSNSIDQQFNSSCFQINWQDQMVNGFWFAALTFSLSAALLAMLSKTWIREYSSGLAAVPYDQARQRQYRFTGQKTWKFGAVLNSLLTLLHISVFLFFAGLIVFLEELDITVFQATTTLFAVVLALYAVVSALPLLFPDCPFRFPLMKILRVWLLQKIRSRRQQTSFRDQELAKIEQDSSGIEARALAWLLQISEMSSEKEDVEEAALAALKHLTQNEEQAKAMLKEGTLPTLYRLFMDCTDEEDERTVRVMRAIDALWRSNAMVSWISSKDRRAPLSDLHVAFFAKLVNLLETSDKHRIVEAAVQLPNQTAGFRHATSPIVAQVSIPKLIDQLENDRFATVESIMAALNLISRIFCFSRNEQSGRTITNEDLRRTIPCVAESLHRAPSQEVTSSALEIVEEIFQLFSYSVSRLRISEWLEKNLALIVDEEIGLLGALLAQLGKKTLSKTEKTLVRQFSSYLMSFQAIRRTGVPKLVSHGYLVYITHDLQRFSLQRDEVSDTSPVDLFNQVSKEGNFTDAALKDRFLQAGSIESLATYFSREPRNPDPGADVFAGLLRRLLRLVNGPHKTRLQQTRIMEILIARCPSIPEEPERRDEDDDDLLRQMDLVRGFLADGTLDPGCVPPVQIDEENIEEEPELELEDPNLEEAHIQQEGLEYRVLEEGLPTVGSPYELHPPMVGYPEDGPQVGSPYEPQ